MCYLFTEERDERDERDESHLARVMNPAVLPAALLLSAHTTSLLSSSCRPTDRLCRAAWSLRPTMSGTLSLSQNLENTKHFPQSVPRLPPTTSRLCKLYSEKKPPRDRTRNTGWGFIISQPSTLRHHILTINQVYQLSTGAGGV